MEGVRGGRLVNLPAEAVETLKALRPEESVVSWAFRFLQSVPGVTMVLSGMSTPEQVDENLATWAEDKPLSEAEFKTVTDIGRRPLRPRHRALHGLPLLRQPVPAGAGHPAPAAAL